MALHNNVFKQQIWQFFQNDIESCLRVAKDLYEKGEKSVFKGGLNFTAALTIMAIVEMCSSYYSGKKAKSTNVAIFIEKYFSPYEPIFKNEKVCEYFFEIFRHGLAHNWTPKMAGVSMDFNEKQCFVVVNSIPILIVPAFYDLVREGLKNFETDLDNNPFLRDKFNKRYEEIIEQDTIAINKFLKVIN